MSRRISSGVHSVGSIDWDRRLFDELIPLPEGTSYNAYLVKGSERTALIDTVYPPKGKELLNNLSELEIETLDYIIPNHAEGDHSGTIPMILERYPGAKVITNPKCRAFLEALMPLPDQRFLTVNDGETISLGDKTLEFILAPWVHWPETMFTYLREDKMLFTCDFFGSHLATTDLYATNEGQVYRAAKRYYAEIMMPFRSAVKINLERIKDLDIALIATSHGPVYNNPDFILRAYRDWASDDVRNEVIIPYVSMYGSTSQMVDHLMNALVKRGIIVKPFNLTKTDIGELAMALVDAATIVIGTPTVLASPHPSAVYAAYLVKALKPKARFASVIGSYLWGGKTVDDIRASLSTLKIELLEPVLVKGYPKEEDFRALDVLAEAILLKHKDLHLLS